MRQDITISDGTVVHTLDAFPFDSSPNLVTTEQGYRRGDRAVDAWTMQRTFAQFFSDGVFGTPADAFQIAKASSGLAVTIQPGMAVIQGAMGGIKDSDGAMTLTLDTAAAAGNVCYGIMLRYDNNSAVRSLGIRAVKGTAGSSPQPPAPDTMSEGVRELRLGYVAVPNGATDLSNATVTNEKGLTVCPYAAPFEEIDMSEVTADAKAAANEALSSLLAYFNEYRGVVDAALEDTEATYLQQQISAIQQQLQNFDLTGSVDNETIEYSLVGLETQKRLRVMDDSITTAKLAGGAVTSEKIGVNAVGVSQLSTDVLNQIGMLDISSWSYQQCKEYLQSLASDDEKEKFCTYITSDKFNGWTAAQEVEFIGLCPTDSGKDLAKLFDFSGSTLTKLADFSDSVEASYISWMLGKKRTVSMGSSYGTKSFTVVGIHQDTLVSGGTAGLSFMQDDILYPSPMSSGSFGAWSETSLRTELNGSVLSGMADSSAIRQVVKQTYNNHETDTSNDYLFVPAEKEVYPHGATTSYPGITYQYFSDVPPSESSKLYRAYQGGAKDYWLREFRYLSDYGYSYMNCSSSGKGSPSYSPAQGNASFGVVPCFCI